MLRLGSLTPKPAAMAYANLIHEAKGCQWIAPCRLAGSPQALAFALSSAAGKPLLAAWVTQGASDLRLPASAQVMDIFGAPLDLCDGRLILRESPVYIHGLAMKDLELGKRVNLSAALAVIEK